MIVDLDIVSAGQLLRTGLRRKDGKVLIAQGTILTNPMLAALRRRGITRLDVEPAPDRTPESFDRAAIESELEHRFSLVIDDPFMQALKRHALQALLGGVPVSSPVPLLEPDEGESDTRTRNEGDGDIAEVSDADI